MLAGGQSLPSDAVLVHIGPFKTGTTAIQGAMHALRQELQAQGVHYPGPGARAVRPISAFMGNALPGRDVAPRAVWDSFAAEIRSQSGRVCVSNEGLALAGPRKIAELVDDLGGDRVHMVMTVRRLDKLLPSAWQQRLKGQNETRTYAEWLTEIVREGAEAPTGGFWRGHNVQDQLDRWTGEIPRERVTLIIADETDPRALARAFESLLALPDGMLELSGSTNASMSWERAEMLRQVNELWAAAGGDARERRRLLQAGFVETWKSLAWSGTEQRVPSPTTDPDLAAAIAALSERQVQAVRDSGVHVIGDPERLLVSPEPAGEGLPLPDQVPTAVAASAVLAVAERAGSADPVRRSEPGSDLDGVGGRELLSALRRRVVSRVKGARPGQ